MKARKVGIISLATLVGMLSLMDLKVAATNTVGRIVDPAAVTYQASKKDMESVVSLGIPAVYAFETGDFNHLAPTYDAKRNVVKLDGVEYRFDKEAMTDSDKVKDGIEESKVQRFLGPNGEKIYRLSKGRKVWGWGIRRNLNKRADPANYYLVDSKGQGFDEYYSGNEGIFLPDYLK